MASIIFNEDHDVKYDRLFNVMRSETTNKVSAILETGLQQTDPLLAKFLQKVKSICAEQLHAASLNVDDDEHFESCNLTKEQFIDCMEQEQTLLFRALIGDLVIPEFDRFTKIITRIYEKCKTNEAGNLADYIPQLARFDPNLWAVSVCTVDGQRFSIGDFSYPFCLQSASKCLNYALALNEHSTDDFHKYVGQEPSGGTFNALTLNHQNRPFNPMINAGAIVTDSLIKQKLPLSDRFDYILQQYQRMSGGTYVGFNNSVFLSERENANRNFAIGYFMRENKVFPKEAKLAETMDLYFQLCSVEVTAESGSIIAATLANGGICPLTGDHVLKCDAVRNTLSLMYSCGMNDYSGQFAFKVGLPAKSGISGVIMLVVPNVMGICLWSPPVDSSANSVRGVQFCDEFVKILNFHNYEILKGRSERKCDPRRTTIAQRASEIVALLSNAALGDVSALRRFRALFGDAIMNQADYDGRTALHLGAAEGHFAVVKFLLQDCGVNPRPRDRFGGTPLDDARACGRQDIVDLILKYEQLRS